MSGEANGWTLYVIDLRKTARTNRRFTKASPEYVPRKPCVYVGLTFRTAKERFDQHMQGIRSARIVHRYGRRVRDKDCKCLRPMTRAGAEKKEAAYAKRLRARGWAVWSN